MGEGEVEVEEKQFDLLRNLKFMGYHRAFGDPHLDRDKTTLADLVETAKFKLCEFFKRPWKDAIWSEYTDEEILVEYFALTYSKNEDAADEFLESIGIDRGREQLEDLNKWFDSEIEQNEREMSDVSSKADDDVHFSPDEVGVNPDAA